MSGTVRNTLIFWNAPLNILCIRFRKLISRNKGLTAAKSTANIKITSIKPHKSEFGGHLGSLGASFIARFVLVDLQYELLNSTVKSWMFHM